jgi:hypothetical protein
MVAVVVAAFIATALAYSGMVLFGLEVAGMAPMEAYALAGFLEVSLVAVALMARNAALEGRPYGVLLTLTWVLSGTSGLFAALHEVAVATASTPYMVVFRFVPPLVAALMWHLALVGERHLVTGHTLDERRREHRVHQYVTCLELWRDARLDGTGTTRSTRKIRAAHRRQRSARDRALKLLTVEDFERRMLVWVDRLEAAERHGNRLDTIGASSVKRGMVRGAAEPTEAPAPAAVTDLDDLLRGAPYQPEQALGELPAFASRVKEAFAVREPATSTEPDTSPHAGPLPVMGNTPRLEPLPETGHTRRVEELDLIGRRPADRAVPSVSAAVASEETAPTEPEAVSGRRPAVGGSTQEPESERDRQIVELAREGRTQNEIAAEVSVSRSTVSRVLRRYGARTELVETETGPELVLV